MTTQTFAPETLVTAETMPCDLYLEALWYEECDGFTLSPDDKARLLGEFVAPKDAARLQIDYSEWFTGVAEAARACREENDAKVAKDPEQFVMIGTFLCERSVHPFERNRAKAKEMDDKWA